MYPTPPLFLFLELLVQKAPITFLYSPFYTFLYSPIIPSSLLTDNDAVPGSVACEGLRLFDLNAFSFPRFPGAVSQPDRLLLVLHPGRQACQWDLSPQHQPQLHRFRHHDVHLLIWPHLTASISLALASIWTLTVTRL